MNRKFRVLIVDDDEGDAGLIGDALTRSNDSICLSIALGGAEAMEYLRRVEQEGEIPDLIP